MLSPDNQPSESPENFPVPGSDPAVAGMHSLKLPVAVGMGNPLYFAVFERGRVAMTEAIRAALPDYKVVDDLTVLYDPNEDKGTAPMGRWAQENLVVIDPRKHEIVAGIKFAAIGHIIVESADADFEALEGHLTAELAKLPPLYDALLDETFQNGRIIFRTVEDQARGIYQYLQSTTPRIYATAEVTGSGVTARQLVYPNIITIEGSSLPLELVPYRLPGAYLLQRAASGVAADKQSLTVPEDLQPGHADLYYVEPINAEWMKKLICCELEIFGAERELGNTRRKWTLNLSEQDVADLADKMAGLPYSDRGGVFCRLESVAHKYPALTITRELIEASIAAEWSKWDTFGKQQGINPRVWAGMELLRDMHYDPQHYRKVDAMDRAADQAFWDRLAQDQDPPAATH